MRILYVGGDLSSGSTAAHRRDALVRLGHEVTSVDESLYPSGRAAAALERWSGRAFRRVRVPIRRFDARGLAGAVVSLASREPFELIWFDKPLYYDAATLKRLRRTSNARIVAYSPDDMLNRDNQSPQLLDALPEFDCFFTTKSYGVAELRALGARQVEFVDNAFEPTLHRPILLTDEERRALGGPVGFVGAFERDRAEAMLWLARNGIPVRVWGTGWRTAMGRVPRELILEDRSAFGDVYPRTVCAFDINLCFLRRVNRDVQTTRSVEIPACGAFMLAERTDEHLRLFREGEEAAFFSTRGELLERVRHYLGDTEERQRVAAAGRRRCIADGYDNDSRMRHMLSTLGIRLEPGQAGTTS